MIINVSATAEGGCGVALLLKGRQPRRKMKCAIMELEAKQASNGNWYVNITAQPENDPFAEELHYRMWCSEALAEKLTAKRPASIELRRVSVKVDQFQRVDEDGTIKPQVFNNLSVVVRQFQNADVDDPTVMAEKLRSSLLKDGKICDIQTDDFDGATGDIPE